LDERRVPLALRILFASLYALQGVTVAYFFNYNKAYMKAAGVPEPVAATVETIALSPFLFKFLFGPVSDRYAPFGMGHRLPYIALGLIAQTIGLAGLTFIDPGRSLKGFGAMAFVAVLGLALYDTCCDGMVVDVTPARDRSKIQSLLMTSRFLATTAFTLLFGFVLRFTGTGPGRGDPVIWICAAIGFFPLILVFRAGRTAARPASVEPFNWSALKSLKRPRTIVLLAFGSLYAVVGIGGETNLASFYRRLGLGEELVGALGAIRYFGRAAGAIALPIAWRGLNRGAILMLGIVGLTVSTAAQAWVAGPVFGGIAAFCFGAANGWNDALFGVLAMESSNPAMAASTFSLLMAVTNLSVAGDALFAHGVAAFAGRDSRVYSIAAACTLALVALVPTLSKRPESVKDERSFAAADDDDDGYP
jgi:PAT family beta-lactamase induction signal transducer AmpG